MIARLRSFWTSVEASYWFYPALFATGGFFLALGLIHLDRTGAAEWLNRFEVFQPSRPGGASNMLTVLAGSIIGVASTVFSITIAAVAYASGTYGPRLLNNFMEDKGNQLSLATFIGTFVYAITVLRTVRAEDEAQLAGKAESSDLLPGFVPQLSLLVAFALMIAAVGVLVFFLHHVPSSIRINAVLEGIGSRLLDKIDDFFPDACIGPLARRQIAAQAVVTADFTGYVRVIAFDELISVAGKHDCELALAVRNGDFVYPGIGLVRASCDDPDGTLADDVRDCFAVGSSRSPHHDLEFSIDELVEIAQRALSPGINDPFTAITALHWLGAATARLGVRDLRRSIAKGDPEACPVIALQKDFDHYVARGFGAARPAVAGSKLAALVALDMIFDAARLIDDAGRSAQLASEADLLLAQVRTELAGPDLEEVVARHQQLVSRQRTEN